MSLYGNLTDDEIKAATEPPKPWPTDKDFPFFVKSMSELRVKKGANPDDPNVFPYRVAELEYTNEETGKTLTRNFFLSRNPKAVFSGIQLALAVGLDPRAVQDEEEFVGCAGRGFLNLASSKRDPSVKVNEVGRFVLPNGHAAS